MKQLSRSLNLQYSGDLIYGVTTVLVVADDLNMPQSELLKGQKARTAASWGNVTIVSNQWLEDSAQQGTLRDTVDYKLLPSEASHPCPLNLAPEFTQRFLQIGCDCLLSPHLSKC